MVMDKMRKGFDMVSKVGEGVSYVVDKTTDIAVKGLDGTRKGIGKASSKAGDGLDDAVGRAQGHKTIKCPRCKSIDVQHIANQRKDFSVKKAIGGSVLFGNVGGLAGFAGKEGKRDEWLCRNCGRGFIK